MIYMHGGLRMRCGKATLVWVPALSVAAVLAAAAQTTPSKAAPVSVATNPTSFEAGVLPVFTAECTACHGTATRVKDMNLSSLDGALKGSESGPVVVPGNPDESRLYQMVRDGKMPMGKPHLTGEQLAAIRLWIESLADSSAKVAAAPVEEV